MSDQRPPPPTSEELSSLLAPIPERDRVLAVEQYDLVAARPHPSDISAYGCVATLAGIILLALAPKVLRALPAGAPRLIVLVLGVLLVVGGFLFRAIVPGWQVRGVAQRASNAIDALATMDYDADPSRWFREAATVLNDAFFSNSPSMVTTFDLGEAAQRLGPALPRMRAFETLVRLERKIYPVFTTFGEPRPVAPD